MACGREGLCTGSGSRSSALGFIPAATPPGPTDTTAAPAPSLLGRAMGTRDDEYDYLFKGEAVGSPTLPRLPIGGPPGGHSVPRRAFLRLPFSVWSVPWPPSSALFLPSGVGMALSPPARLPATSSEACASLSPSPSVLTAGCPLPDHPPSPA